MRISDWSSDVCSSDLAGDDDFRIGAAGDRHVALLLFRRRRLRRRRVGGRRIGILGERGGRDEGGAEKEQAGEERPLGHGRIFPRQVKEGAGPFHGGPLPDRIASDQAVGSAVQLPLSSPNSAVAELQVQSAYHVSLASRTAPT